MLDHESPNFKKLHRNLLGSALAKGIPLADAEDLVGNAVESALRHFDPGRGAFAGLCWTTLSNRIKNYWRDRKHTLVLPDEVEDPEWEGEFPDDGPDITERLEAVMGLLSPEETKFLLELRAVYEEQDDRAVSKAARRARLTPAEGWNMFRRIQRKARRATERTVFTGKVEFSLEKAMAQRRPHAEAVDFMRRAFYLPGDRSRQYVRRLAELVATDLSFDRLIHRLGPESAVKAESLLS